MKKKLVIIISILLVIFIGVSAFAGNYLVNYALMVDENKRIGSMGSEPYDGKQDTEAQKVYDEWVKGVALEELHLKNKEDMNLWAQVYKNENNDHKYVLAVHGYTVDHRDIAPAIVEFHKKGYEVIAVDQRGRGHSDGQFLSMGWFEKNDILEWINLIVNKDKDAKIVLYGESMGAATLMMAVGEKLPSNVQLLIEDCGYTSAYAMFKDQLKERFNLPEFPFLPAANVVSTIRTGFSFDDASAIKQLEKANLPILFIHGGADDYVPTYMGKELYGAYKGEKELLIIEGAGHGASADVDANKYYQAIFDFIDKYSK